MLEELGNAQKVRVGGLVQLTVRVKPATKPRMGRNPATGDEIKIAGERIEPRPADGRAPRPATRRAELSGFTGDV